MWTVYDVRNSELPDDSVAALAFDAGGTLWIGTGDLHSGEGAGLAAFDGRGWRVYNTENSGLPNNTIWNIEIDGRGNKWISTNGGGLAVYREGGVDLAGAQ
jgi:ligand-binding sensor domain-containing protein